ncbi:MAG: cation-translocating P-type ATPase [Chthoniobacteraceae bacterium]
MNAEVPATAKPRRWLPRFEPREVEVHGPHEEDDHHEAPWQTQLAASVLCLVLGIAAAWTPWPATSIPLFVLSYLAGGWFAAADVKEKLGEGALDIHFLMLAVAAGAAAIGKWSEGATLLFLFSASSALEHFAMDRTQRAINALFHTAPKTAVVLAPWGAERQVPVEELTPGMRLLVRPGELFPVDAEIAKGQTAADESNLTGEAMPVEKEVGDAVLAGTLNTNGSVEVIVTRPAKESALQKIIHLIQHAQQSKAPSQRFTDRFGSGYTYAVLALTAAMFFVWWLAFGHTAHRAFYNAMTLLVVASPCALVLSIPSAILAAIASGARRGILFRGGAAVEQLAEVKAVAMDKTGTLTTGDLRVETVESFPAGREREVIELAATLDRHSSHPLARAIVRHAKRQGIEPREIDGVSSTFGAGVSAHIDGGEVRLGKRAWAQPPDHESCRSVAAPETIGVSEVWLTAPGLCGRILLRDDVRPEARGLIESLRRRGVRTLVLTGDRQTAADQLAKDLALDEVRAELKPEDKLTIIGEFAARGEKIAMVGDGVNDAPSIAAAHVGVAMGARGSDAALEQADVVLMHDRLENFLGAYELSRRSRAVIRQNLAISLGVIVLLVTLAMFERIPLTIGVVGHEGSTLIVVLNSLRLLAGGRRG